MKSLTFSNIEVGKFYNFFNKTSARKIVMDNSVYFVISKDDSFVYYISFDLLRYTWRSLNRVHNSIFVDMQIAHSIPYSPSSNEKKEILNLIFREKDDLI